MTTKNIQLFDAVNNKVYHLSVSPEDHKKALQDAKFAQSLLVQARQTINVELSQENCETEEETTLSECITFEINKNETEDVVTSRVQYSWPYNYVIELIKSMGNHIDDLNHPMKRRLVFDFVANDLMSKNIEVNTVMVQNKWKNLVRSYRTAKENKTKTGRGPCKFYFYDLMDEILGSDSSINTNKRDSELTPAVVEVMLPEDPLFNSDDESDAVNTTKTVACLKNTNSDTDSEKEGLDISRTKYMWQFDHTIELIKTVGNHMDDFNKPIKRKDVFELIASDLVNKNIEVTASMAQIKWKNLVRSYRYAKEIKTRTGYRPSRFQFYELMEEILGRNSKNNPLSRSIKSLKKDSESNTAIVEVLVSESPQFSSDDEQDIPKTPTYLKSDMFETESENEEVITLKTPYVWPHDHVVELIKSVDNHIGDFNQLKKRKDFFEIIASDLVNKNIKVDASIVQNKWKNLIRSYRSIKNNKSAGHRAPRFYFYDSMEAILKKYCSNRGSQLASGISKLLLPDNPQANSNAIDEQQLTHNSSKTVKRNAGFLSDKKLMFEYITLKKEEYAKRQKRHDCRMQLVKKKLKLEQRKLKLLEMFMKTRGNMND